MMIRVLITMGMVALLQQLVYPPTTNNLETQSLILLPRQRDP